MQTSIGLQVPDSSRLQFRLLDADDAELLFELDQDEQVMQFINGGRKTSRSELYERVLPRMLAYRDPLQGYGMWQVSTKADYLPLPSQFLGWILVRPMGFFSATPATDDLEVGWRFKQMAWGKGFATEAANAVMAVLSQQPQVLRFSAIAHPNNAASIAVMKKLGMQFIRQGWHQDPLGTYEVVYYQKPAVN